MTRKTAKWYLLGALFCVIILFCSIFGLISGSATADALKQSHRITAAEQTIDMDFFSGNQTMGVILVGQTGDDRSYFDLMVNQLTANEISYAVFDAKSAQSAEEQLAVLSTVYDKMKAETGLMDEEIVLVGYGAGARTAARYAANSNIKGMVLVAPMLERGTQITLQSNQFLFLLGSTGDSVSDSRNLLDVYNQVTGEKLIASGGVYKAAKENAALKVISAGGHDRLMLRSEVMQEVFSHLNTISPELQLTVGNEPTVRGIWESLSLLSILGILYGLYRWVALRKQVDSCEVLFDKKASFIALLINKLIIAVCTIAFALIAAYILSSFTQLPFAIWTLLLSVLGYGLLSILWYRAKPQYTIESVSGQKGRWWEYLLAIVSTAITLALLLLLSSSTGYFVLSTQAIVWMLIALPMVFLGAYAFQYDRIVSQSMGYGRIATVLHSLYLFIPLAVLLFLYAMINQTTMEQFWPCLVTLVVCAFSGILSDHLTNSLWFSALMQAVVFVVPCIASIRMG